MAYIYMIYHCSGRFGSRPIYKIKGNFIHRTHRDAGGCIAAAVMEIQCSSIHMTHQYPAKFIFAPIFEIKDAAIYMTHHHPDNFIESEIMEVKRVVSSEETVRGPVAAEPVIDEVPQSDMEEPGAALDLGLKDMHV